MHGGTRDSGDGESIWKKLMRCRPKQNRRNDRAGNDGAHEDRRRFAAGQIDKQNAANCAQHGNAAEHERINDRRRLRCQSQRADQNRAD